MEELKKKLKERVEIKNVKLEAKWRKMFGGKSYLTYKDLLKAIMPLLRETAEEFIEKERLGVIRGTPVLAFLDFIEELLTEEKKKK